MAMIVPTVEFIDDQVADMLLELMNKGHLTKRFLADLYRVLLEVDEHKLLQDDYSVHARNIRNRLMEKERTLISYLSKSPSQ